MSNDWTIFAYAFMALMAFAVGGPPNEKGAKNVEHGYPHQPSYPEHKPVQEHHHQPAQHHHQPAVEHKQKQQVQPVVEYKPIVEYKPVVVQRPVVVEHQKPIVEYKPAHQQTHHQPHQQTHHQTQHHGKCGKPSEEIIKCLSEWTCQNFARLDFRVCLQSGNHMLRNLWQQQNHNLMNLLRQ